MPRHFTQCRYLSNTLAGYIILSHYSAPNHGNQTNPTNSIEPSDKLSVY
ncbi:hypothetical protein [Xenorhabdus khoisanae]|nr:hypothetical protein [Xenorhabdus khoisanae]